LYSSSISPTVNSASDFLLSSQTGSLLGNMFLFSLLFGFRLIKNKRAKRKKKKKKNKLNLNNK
jgi:hypothetical protein